MFRLTIALLLAMPALAGADDKDEAQKELKKFEGTWKVKSFEFSGKKDGPPAEEREKMRMVFKGDKLTIKGTPRGDHDVTVELDPSKKPAHINLNPPKDEGGRVVKGIYKFEKDTLTICGNQGDDRPTEFALKDGTQIALLVLERIKDKE